MILPALLSPAMTTLRSCGGVVAENVAVTLCAAFMVTVQVGEAPVHPPDHPVNVPFAPHTAVSVTVVLASRVAEQTVAPSPQLMPPVEEVTFPMPMSPAVATCSNCNVERSAKLAVTATSALNGLTEHVGEKPEHCPPQPVNSESIAG